MACVLYIACVLSSTSMTNNLRGEERRLRDAAFERAIAELRPEFGLAAQIKSARVRARLTQAQLAGRMGTTQSAIARLEAGLESPKIRTLEKLAEVTGSRLVLRLDEWIR